jgi:DNA-binding MarR family transcriptional regulator
MQQLANQVRAVMVAADTYRRSMAAALGVGVTEASALGEIRQDGPLTPSELSRRLGLTSPSVTSLLDRLEAAQLVVRRRHPVDRRSVLIQLTDLGEAALAAAFELFSDAVADSARAADPVHVEELVEVLAGIAESLRMRAGDRTAIAGGLAERVATHRRGQDSDPL